MPLECLIVWLVEQNPVSRAATIARRMAGSASLAAGTVASQKVRPRPLSAAGRDVGYNAAVLSGEMNVACGSDAIAPTDLV